MLGFDLLVCIWPLACCFGSNTQVDFFSCTIKSLFYRTKTFTKSGCFPHKQQQQHSLNRAIKLKQWQQSYYSPVPAAGNNGFLLNLIVLTHICVEKHSIIYQHISITEEFASGTVNINLIHHIKRVFFYFLLNPSGLKGRKLLSCRCAMRKGKQTDMVFYCIRFYFDPFFYGLSRSDLDCWRERSSIIHPAGGPAEVPAHRASFRSAAAPVLHPHVSTPHHQEHQPLPAPAGHRYVLRCSNLFLLKTRK